MDIMSKSDEGLSPVVVVIIAAVILLGIGFLLFQRGGIPVNIPGVPVSTQRASEADFAFIDDPVIKKHLVAQANQTAYRYKSYSDAADLNFVNEMQIKGEDSNTRYIESDRSGKEMKHKIEIGDTIYIKDYSDGKWWKQTITPQEEKELPQEEKPAEPLDFKEEYSKPDLKFNSLGKEPCGPSAAGLTCFKYEQLTGGSEGMAFKRTFWFDDQKYLLRREESTVGEFGVKMEYSYDGINIVPPSPTKDVPESKNIYDYYYGYDSNSSVPSESDLKKLQQQFGGSPDVQDLQNYTPPDNPQDSAGY